MSDTTNFIGIYHAPGAKSPLKATPGSAGADIYAHIVDNKRIKVADQNNKVLEWPTKDGKLVIPPFFKVLVPTGLFFDMPEPYFIKLFSRSSCWKTGLALVNSVGIIDTDYNNELMVAIINLSDKNGTIENGERIAQMIVEKKQDADVLFKTLEAPPGQTGERAGGFGSTGTK